MALRFPRFSQGLAQDPTTVVFGLVLLPHFESHDDITEERLYQNIFVSHFGQLAIIFLWTSGNLSYVAWQGNFESGVQDPLHTLGVSSLGFGQVTVHVAIPASRGETHHDGAFAHGAIFFIRDYNPEQNEDNVLARMLDHKEAIISHLSWASLFLGFHTPGLYVHNDVMLAFLALRKQILIEPIFAQ
ncbi:hypothetical protein HAX54_026889 [Datura stramonium]|uniref:Uncharacterized protein n=1 Tax=Datura stramonium TaxID=4076 RepID=A0ABS8V4I7_DATST|nr:hypothetical protein [Datura stramonium]